MVRSVQLDVGVPSRGVGPGAIDRVRDPFRRRRGGGVPVPSDRMPEAIIRKWVDAALHRIDAGLIVAVYQYLSEPDMIEFLGLAP
jgi:hypothetical protein